MIRLLTAAALIIALTSFYRTNIAAIKLDGVITNDEWAGATQYDLSTGGKLYVLHEANTLYLALKGNSPGWAHMYIHWKDSINVMHASAALGDQLYIRDNQHWKLQTKFNWEVREFVYNEALQQKQNDYYHKKGWVANNNNAGDKHTLEYKIDLQRFPGASVVALYADGKTYSSYPAGLTDNTQLKELVTGMNPDNLRFNPASWSTFK